MRSWSFSQLSHNNQMMHQPINSLISTPTQKIKDLINKSSFQEALSLYKHLHSSNIQTSPSILPSLLKISSLSFALQLHSFILKTDLLSHPITLNSLLSAYSKHLEINSAQKLFDTMPLKDPITYNSMINCYAQNGYLSKSIETFNEMYFAGFEPKPELVAAVASACAYEQKVSLGRAIHAQSIVRSILDHCVLLQTSLIDMYSKCGDLDSGLKVFDSMEERNVVSWTAMINGCVNNGSYSLSLDLLREMSVEGVEPNRATMVTILPACGELGALKLGKEIHGFVLRCGLQLESRVIGSLITMYSRCDGAINLALLVFERAKERDTISWSSIMAATSKIGDSIQTLRLFRRMKIAGVEPNSITMLAVIDACIGLGSLDHGLTMFGYIVKFGFISSITVGNSLINMFAKCGCLNSASRVYSEMMPIKDLVSYSAMIQSYGIHGRGHDALKLFEEMRETGYKRDDIVLLSILSACNHSGLIEEGKRIFESMREDFGVEHYACYVDLLARNGRIEEAIEVVRRMPMKRSLKILTSLVSSCKVYGKIEMAMELVYELINLEENNCANFPLLSMIHTDEEIRRVMRERGMKKNAGCSRILTF